MVRCPRCRIRLEIHSKMSRIEHFTRPTHHDSDISLALGKTRLEQETSANSDDIVNFDPVQKFAARNIDIGNGYRTLDGTFDQIRSNNVHSGDDVVCLYWFGTSARYILNTINIPVANNCDW